MEIDVFEPARCRNLCCYCYYYCYARRRRPGPDFMYTENPKSQNQHGRYLQGQSAISLPCFGPRVALFLEREPWALKQSTHFSIFERFEMLHLPDLLVPLAPPSPSLTNFDVFSACFALIYSFLLYVRGVRASSTRVCRSAQFNRALPIAAQCLSFGAPPSHISRRSSWRSQSQRVT